MQELADMFNLRGIPYIWKDHIQHARFNITAVRTCKSLSFNTSLLLSGIQGLYSILRRKKRFKNSCPRNQSIEVHCTCFSEALVNCQHTEVAIRLLRLNHCWLKLNMERFCMETQSCKHLIVICIPWIYLYQLRKHLTTKS